MGISDVAINVPFSVSNGPFAVGTKFTAYLSKDGFVTKTAIGTLTGTTSGTIAAKLPSTVASGTTYRIRVDADTPAPNGTTGTANTTDLTIVSYKTNEVAPFTATYGAQQVTLSWTNPTSCFQKVTIIARANNSVTVKPSGTFTANSVFGSGTDLGTAATPGQFVVYDGTGTSVTVTGLTNLTTYNFTAYVTNGDGYSDGTNTSATPVQNVTVTSVLLPQYLVGRTGTTHTDRLPFAYRTTLSGLEPSRTYRYYNSAVLASDGATSTGSGISVFPKGAGTFTRATNRSLNTAGNYSTFTTDASGAYTGWFVMDPTASATFDAGNQVYMRIVLNDGYDGTNAVYFLTTPESVEVRTLGSASTQATAVSGESFATSSNFVFTYDNTAGTGRPLAGTFVESEGTNNTDYAAFYLTNVEGKTGAWGVLTPNNNANGIRRIAQYALSTGALTGCAATDADGTWASGTVTASPTGGSKPLVFTSLDAPLTCDVYVGFNPQTVAVAEGNTGTKTVTLNVTVVNTPSTPLEVSITDAGTGTATAGTDYTFTPQTLTFTQAGTQTVTVTVMGDKTDESNETVKLGLAINAGSATVVSSPATLVLTNDDALIAGGLWLEDDFNYPIGQDLKDNNWTTDNTGNAVLVVTGNNFFQQYPLGVTDSTTSRRVKLSEGMDYHRAFSAATGATSLYAAAVVRVSTATNTGDYFLHFNNEPSASTARGKVYVKAGSSASTFLVGLRVGSDSNTPIVYSTTPYSINQNYLFVLRYDVVASGLDQAKLYVMNEAGASAAEPATAEVTATGIDSYASLSGIGLRQGGASAPTLTVDGIRVGGDWGSTVGRVTATYYNAGIAAGNYYEVGINNEGTLTPAGAVNIEGNLTLTSGLINTTTTNSLTLYQTNSRKATVSGGSASSYVNGPVKRYISAVATPTSGIVFPVGQDFAYRPLALNITTQTQPTTYTASQQDGAPANQNFAGSNIKRVSKMRYYTVSSSPEPTTGQFLGNITLSFDPAEDGVTDAGAPTLVVAKSNGSGAWENIGHSSNSSTTITSDNFTTFGDFVLASTIADIKINPLPVELTAFTAERQGTDVQIKWATASERNSASFLVERSADGLTFQAIGRVAAQGTSTTHHSYQFTDGKSLSGLAYYRLRQLDQDGTAQLSVVRTVQGRPLQAGIYPNPVQNVLHVEMAATNGSVQAIITDLVGREVYRTIVPSSHQIDLHQLPQGSYLLMLEGQQVHSTHKLVKTN
ncbi:T9SS type A sorting domain-containing protein [Hymenobacter sp. DG25A]|uniref:T9SS type A sorting domain-containing protein n=1 Tax=Hymenobacter sp. DG25A TaxID=1385663 RepID=UPI0006C83A03|nr:T9SS type A sorting domain-containing protein [Hymenobacter sp. DG25A]